MEEVKIDMVKYKEYLIYKIIEEEKNRNIKKWKRRYKKYLNESYFESNVRFGKDEYFYKKQIIMLIIKNKWIERKLKRK